MSGQQKKIGVRSVPFTLMNSDPLGSPPTVALVFKLDIDTTGDEIKISYLRAKRITLDTNGKFERALVKIAARTFDFDSVKTEEPYESALSIRNYEIAYIVFQLSGKKKLQFSNSSEYLFSLGKGVPVNLFGNARKVDRTGVSLLPTEDAPGCQVAYFAMDGAKKDDASKADLANGMPFNIHLDFISKSKERGKPAVDSLVPFIIDPDIRYPGGTFDDEGGG